MRTRRLVGITALGAAALSLLVIPGAHAQEAGEAGYGATADGRALVLDVAGQGITAGKTHAAVTSTPSAGATGDGIANPLAPVGSTGAEVTAEGIDGSTDETCEGGIDQIPGLLIELACSASVAAIEGGTPSAASTARVGTIAVNPVAQLIDTPLGEVVDQVEGGVDQLLGGLSPVLQPVDEATDLGLEDTLADLFEALLNGAPLASVTIGDTESTTVATAENVTSTCVASGGRIDVLDPAPVGDIDLPPVISLEIGNAATSVVAARDGSEPAAQANPAIVTLHVPSIPALDGLGVGPGETIEIPLPEPLGTSTISVAGGSTGVDDDGNSFARASGVRIHLLDGEALQGGIELALADCLSVAGVTAAAAPPTTEAPTTTEAPRPLPRTGSNDGLALAAAVGLAGLGLVLLRRHPLR